MLDHVWPDIAVEEANLTVHLSPLRKAIGADVVVTVPGRGYRFVLSIDQGRAALTNTALDMCKLSSGAPFTNMSGAPEQEFIAAFVNANSGLARGSVIQIERAMDLCPVYPPFCLGIWATPADAPDGMRTPSPLSRPTSGRVRGAA